MRKFLTFLFIAALLVGCGKSSGAPTPTIVPTTSVPPTAAPTVQPTATLSPTLTLTATTIPTAAAILTATTAPSATSQPTASPAPSATPEPSSTPLPPETPAPPVTGGNPSPEAAAPAGANSSQPGGPAALEHILLIVFENHNYSEVIGQQQLTNFNRLAQENVLFTHYYAVGHPSLPNYLALTGGSTFGIHSDCMACFVDAPNLADRLEAGGKTWKTYQEGMNSACSLVNTSDYDLNHNPWLYYNSIRTNAGRCGQSVVPLDQLDDDLRSNRLPNFAQIMPNLCNAAHNCALSQADQWLGKMISQLQSSPALGQNYAIFIVFDESSYDNSGCCGLPKSAGGLVPAILISPLAKSAFQDDTPLDHYSFLKTVLQAWNLPGLGHTDNPDTPAITAPWR